MSESDRITLDEVNEATIELLRRRIETQVRTNFLKTVTIPIGGGGVIAIIAAVFFWIPAQIKSILNQPTVQENLVTAINGQIKNYIEEPENQKEIELKIKEATSAEIAREVERQLPDQVATAVQNYIEGSEGTERTIAAVRDYLASDQGKAVLSSQVSESAKTHFEGQAGADQVREAASSFLSTGDGKGTIEDLVAKYLKGKEGSSALVEAVNQALAPVVSNVGEAIIENRDRLVMEFEPQSLHGHPKESMAKLHEYLEPSNVDRIKEAKLSVVLTKTIRPDTRYAVFAIERYLEDFSSAFGDLFKYVAIQYGSSSKLVALIPRGQFARFVRDEPEMLEDFLNDSESPESEIRGQLIQWFGRDCARFVAPDRSVLDVLRDSQIWAAPQRLDQHVAVVKSDGKLDGTTSRGTLVRGLMHP